MAQPDDLEPRVSAPEDRIQDLTGRVRNSERDAAAARVLAGGADRDVEQIRSEWRDFRQATTATFNAIREDLADLRIQVNEGFARFERGYAHFEGGFAEVRGRLDAAAAGQQQIVGLLTALIDQQDER